MRSGKVSIDPIVPLSFVVVATSLASSSIYPLLLSFDVAEPLPLEQLPLLQSLLHFGLSALWMVFSERVRFGARRRPPRRAADFCRMFAFVPLVAAAVAMAAAVSRAALSADTSVWFRCLSAAEIPIAEALCGGRRDRWPPAAALFAARCVAAVTSSALFVFPPVSVWFGASSTAACLAFAAALAETRPPPLPSLAAANAVFAVSHAFIYAVALCLSSAPRLRLDWVRCGAAWTPMLGLAVMHAVRRIALSVVVVSAGGVAAAYVDVCAALLADAADSAAVGVCGGLVAVAVGATHRRLTGLGHARHAHREA